MKSADGKGEFAERLGFTSFLELFEASQPVAARDDKAWFTTALSDGRWIAWNETDLEAPVRHASREEAAASIPN